MTIPNPKSNLSNGLLSVKKLAGNTELSIVKAKRGFTGSSLKRRPVIKKQTSETQSQIDITDFLIQGNRDIMNLMDYNPVTQTRPETH